MRRSWLIFCSAIVVCCAVGLASETIEIARERSGWIVTVQGTSPISKVSGVRISSHGDVIVRGTPGNDIRYTVTRKVPAGDEIQVRRTATELVRQAKSPGALEFLITSGQARIEVPRAVRSVSLATTSGIIDASDLEGSLRADAAAGKIVVDRIGGDVEIHSGGGPTYLGSIGGLVRCFSGGGPIRASVVKGQGVFETQGGDIRLGQVLGPVRAVTAAGSIQIEHAGGPVYADTFGGPIEILRALGLVVARNSGGPIQVTSAPSVECQSASGAIRLNNVSGSLRASTVRGSIIAEILSGRPLEDSFISTGAGDITVLIPSNVGVRVEAVHQGSRLRQAIVSDFAGLDITTQDAGVVARGKINGGGPLLRLTGAGGRIEIKRK